MNLLLTKHQHRYSLSNIFCSVLIKNPMYLCARECICVRICAKMKRIWLTINDYKQTDRQTDRHCKAPTYKSEPRIV